MQENNNTFQESWSWANQQLVKNNKLLEAENSSIDSKTFLKKAKCFTRRCFFRNFTYITQETYLFDTSCYFASLRKQPTFGDATTGFPAKGRLRNERRNSILMTRHYSDLGSAPDWLNQISHAALFVGWGEGLDLRELENAQKRKSVPKLFPIIVGSDASSVWNFCACFSDVIRRGNKW